MIFRYQKQFIIAKNLIVRIIIHQLFMVLCFLILHITITEGYANLVYPSAVDIHDFRSEKVIYKPNEKVVFSVEFTVTGNHENNNDNKLLMQVWIEKKLDAPFLAISTTSPFDPGTRHKVDLVWSEGGEDVQGHRAYLRFIDTRGRLLAEADTIFDIAKNWIPVIRMASQGSWKLANPDTSSKDILNHVENFRTAYINTLNMWTTFPESYELAPEVATWQYQYHGSGVKPVASSALKKWEKALHNAGMKYVAYNETSAVHGPDEWKIWATWNRSAKPLALYFEDEGMFTPNALKIADHFAEELEKSIQIFKWDAILLDNATSTFIETSRGVTKDNKPITGLTPGEVGFRYLKPARDKALKLNPDFKFLSQNATSISHNGVKKAPDKIFPWIKKNGERLDARKYSEVTDMYTLEIDAHNTPHDGRYPLTYEKMSISLNSIVKSTGRPLLAWAQLVTPYYDEYSKSFIRPYMAIHLASRTQVHDHFGFYGGALSPGKHSPASIAFFQYNRFLARFSYYLTETSLEWVIDGDKYFSIEASRPLFWKKTVYKRQLENGHMEYILHLLNLPTDGKILNQKEIPPPAQNITIKIKADIDPVRVTALSADDPSLKPLVLELDHKTEGMFQYRVPPIDCWTVIVIEGK